MVIQNFDKASKEVVSICLLLLIIGLSIPFAIPQQIILADDGVQPITDSALITALSKQGINPSNVRLYEEANIAHPYSDVYVSIAKSGQMFSVFSNQPQVNTDGIPIQPQWIDNRDGSFSTAPNTFEAHVAQTTVEAICTTEQEWAQVGQSLTWNPQVFVGDIEYFPVDPNPTLLNTDPSGLFPQSILQWDYSVCVRQLKLVKGSLVESWIFYFNPGDTVRIVHNQQGDFGLTLGAGADEVTTQEAVLTEEPKITPIRQLLEGKIIDGGKSNPSQPIANDVEVFYAESFDTAVYPLTLGGSLTFDMTSEAWHGLGYYGCWGSTYTDVHDYEFANETFEHIIQVGQRKAGSTYYIYRNSVQFDTSSIPDAATVSAATLSLYLSSDSSSYNFYVTVVHSSCHGQDDDYSKLHDSIIGYGELSTSSLSTNKYYDIVLYDGLTDINKTFYTQFGIRSSRDISTTSPSGNEYVNFTGYIDANPPRLVVTYTGDPVIVTLAASNITINEAILNGSITSVGASNVTQRGWVYDTVSHTTNPGNVIPHLSGYTYHDLIETGNFSTGTFANNTAVIAPLVRGTTYYVRAYANNTIAQVYGDQLSFTTLCDAPTVITNAASGVNIASAQLNGQITDLGGAACDYYKFQWGYGTGAYDFSYTSPSGSYGLSTYSYSGASLMPNITYYYIFEAHNTGGWGYGAEKSFITLPPSSGSTSPAGSLAIEVAGNCSTVYTYLPLYTSLVNTYGLATQGYVNVSSTNTDLIELNGATLPYLPVTDRLAFLLTNVATYQSETLVYNMGTATSQTGFPIIVGYNGNLTRADTDAMEPGHDFEFDVAGYLDMSTGNSSKWYRYIFYKKNAVALYVSGAGNLTASIGNDTAPTQSVTIGNISTGYHRIQVVGNLTNNEFSIYMDSSTTFSGNTTIATTGNNTNSWYFMGNNTMPAMTYFKEYTGADKVLQVQYQPTAYLIGNTTVPDLAHGYSATIAWGTNPSCVTFTTTGEIVSGLAASGGTGNESWIPTFNLIGWYDPELGDLPFYETFNDAAIQMGMPTHSLYLIVMMGTAIAVGLGVMVFTGSSMLSIIAVGATMLAAADTGVVSVWFVLVFALVSISILYLSRQT